MLLPPSSPGRLGGPAYDAADGASEPLVDLAGRLTDRSSRREVEKPWREHRRSVADIRVTRDLVVMRQAEETPAAPARGRRTWSAPRSRARARGHRGRPARRRGAGHRGPDARPRRGAAASWCRTRCRTRCTRYAVTTGWFTCREPPWPTTVAASCRTPSAGTSTPQPVVARPGQRRRPLRPSSGTPGRPDARGVLLPLPVRQPGPLRAPDDRGAVEAVGVGAGQGGRPVPQGPLPLPPVTDEGRRPAPETTLLPAFGIAPEDIVWVDGPVTVTSLVGCTPMWHNAPPFYVHPAIRETWARLRAGLIGTGPVEVPADLRDPPAVEPSVQQRRRGRALLRRPRLHDRRPRGADLRRAGGDVRRGPRGRGLRWRRHVQPGLRRVPRDASSC